MDAFGSGQGTLVSCSEQSNKRSGSVKGGKFLD
jgi:hypothetical protein